MSAACGEGCGWCGRCTAAWEREAPETPPCDHCRGEAFDPVTTPLGVYCSSRCEALAAAEFTEQMKRNGFQIVEKQHG